MNVNFYLSPSGTIMASFTFGTNRIRVSSGDKCKSNNWDQDKQKVSGSDQEELNFKLKRLEAWFYNEHRRQVNNGLNPNSETIRREFLIHMNRKQKQVKSTDLIGFIPEYLKTAKNKKGQPYSPGTSLNYLQLEKHLKGFRDTTGRPVDFAYVDKDFYNRFVAYLRTKAGKDTSVGAYISSFKHILNVALDEGLSQCIEQKKSYFRAFAEDSDQEALSEMEINSIYEAVLTDPYRSHIRDLFVLTCHTGLRYSDWGNYKPENLVEGGTVLKAFTKKTRELVYIPLHPRAKEILSRVFKSIYPIPTAIDMNRIIKRIAKDVGIGQSRTKTFTHDGKSKSVIMNRGDMISCHSARRSFVTNASRNDVPDSAIMRITGHKTEKVFRKYVRIEKLESAQSLIGHKFFAG